MGFNSGLKGLMKLLRLKYLIILQQTKHILATKICEQGNKQL